MQTAGANDQTLLDALYRHAQGKPALWPTGPATRF